MFKKIFLFALVTLLVVSCSDNGAKDDGAASVQLTVEEMSAKAADYVDQNVSITGTVVHVCRHGGKKMFIIGDDPDQRIKVMANAQVGSFDVALEGSNVTVQGLIQAEVVEVEVEKSHEHAEAAHVGHDNDADDHKEGEKKEECEFENVTYYSLDCSSVTEI